MAFICRVAAWFSGFLPGIRYALRLSYRPGMVATMDGTGHDSDGPKYGGVHYDSQLRTDVRFHGDEPSLGRKEWFSPTDVLGLISLVGLFTYALIRGMDTTTAAMLSGLFGVLLGRTTKSNGSKL